MQIKLRHKVAVCKRGVGYIGAALLVKLYKRRNYGRGDKPSEYHKAAEVSFYTVHSYASQTSFFDIIYSFSLFFNPFSLFF